MGDSIRVPDLLISVLSHINSRQLIFEFMLLPEQFFLISATEMFLFHYLNAYTVRC